ncbi:hypothetical protein [Deinococcus multiflagellatus]|uniref:Uncharacterized protein n=1 Tax=Deinococcus multiflagellatus TaxID=1656887 RepID=A0ABW1ZG17_9DEIO|nr:hypothetical protein [Deinococcus multiflagellatus]MBZ9711730.1 hypothetical protein [Deinococcus multiflagellatus]
MAPVSDRAVLSGTWFVVRTSLPLWRTRDNPSVTYAPLPDGRVVDTVRFTRRGRLGLIVGLDRPLPGGGWEWRGLSLLTRWTPSRWQVLHAEEDWAVTVFARTPFTPAGLDVYARTRTLSPGQEIRVHEMLRGLSGARPFLAGLFSPVHDED